MAIFRNSDEIWPAGPPGHRAYVIGDIHGRLDLLKELLSKIHAEIEADRPANCLLVFLGDLIDRGPNSAQVIERLRTYGRPGVETVFLFGNHEEVLLRVLAGDTALLEKWQWFGGAECLLSYGLNPNELVKASNDVALAMVRSAIPVEHVRFIRSFWDAWSFGDYLFVHAGVRPGIELEQQRQSDLRWIRDPFLSDESDLGFFVVHGHTITTSVEQRRNRIGIDTGAYRTGILTALAIEGTERWLLQTNIE